uniref:Dirigent protein n=1 Tax=Kalanchoe fedtschenkoi TaxID=63787 RepID=A0A7N0SYE4_KALFE
MASFSVSTVAFLVLLAAAAAAMSSSQAAAASGGGHHKLKKTEMTFYMHDWETPTKEENVTNVIIAGKPKTEWDVLTFGSLNAFDDALTAAIDRGSAELGRAHGVYVNTALDGSDLHMMVSFLFTNRAYNGSTIEIRGANRLLQASREVSIVSGTGRFRLARGWASIESASLDFPKSNAVLRWNLTVFHY